MGSREYSVDGLRYFFDVCCFVAPVSSSTDHAAVWFPKQQQPGRSRKSCLMIYTAGWTRNLDRLAIDRPASNVVSGVGMPGLRGRLISFRDARHHELFGALWLLDMWRLRKTLTYLQVCRYIVTLAHRGISSLSVRNNFVKIVRISIQYFCGSFVHQATVF